MESLFPNLSSPAALQKDKREKNKQLKQMFSGRITGNFLLEILGIVMNTLVMKGELYQFFKLGFDEQSLFKGDNDAAEYEVCRYIIGAHRSNIIFLEDKERADLESNENYKRKLVNDVLTNIRLRGYAGQFFRKRQIVQGDEFIFFNLPHDLFVLSVRSQGLLTKSGTYAAFYAAFFNKALASLSLLEDNFVDASYPHCRSMIELYVKLLALKFNPEALSEYSVFEDYELHTNLIEQVWPEEFLARFKERKCKRCNVKAEFLHFGWVDAIPDYYEIVKKSHPYSINGLCKYIVGKDENFKQNLEGLQSYYKICHAYSHGGTTRCLYPLNDYFQIVGMMSLTIPHVYRMLCEDAGEAEEIDGYDIVSKVAFDMDTLVEQIQKRTSENFEAYYRKR